jgi:hypothetical protein
MVFTSLCLESQLLVKYGLLSNIIRSLNMHVTIILLYEVS